MKVFKLALLFLGSHALQHIVHVFPVKFCYYIYAKNVFQHVL